MPRQKKEKRGKYGLKNSNALGVLTNNNVALDSGTPSSARANEIPERKKNNKHKQTVASFAIATSYASCKKKGNLIRRANSETTLCHNCGSVCNDAETKNLEGKTEAICKALESKMSSTKPQADDEMKNVTETRSMKLKILGDQLHVLDLGKKLQNIDYTLQEQARTIKT